MINNSLVTDGLRDGEPVYCPVNCRGENDCPYSDERGICHLVDPMKGCEDFATFWQSWEEYDAAEEYEADEREDFSHEEITFAEEAYGYRVIDDYEDVGFNPYLGAYDFDC